MIIRPATAKDLETVDGRLPAKSCRAMVATEDQDVIGVWGIYPQNTRYVLFASFTEQFRQSKRNFVLAVASARKLISARPSMPVLSVADPEISGSEVLLKHMGFEHVVGNTYQMGEA